MLLYSNNALFARFSHFLDFKIEYPFFFKSQITCSIFYFEYSGIDSIQNKIYGQGRVRRTKGCAYFMPLNELVSSKLT